MIVGSDVGASVGADDGETLVSLVGLRVGDTLRDDNLILFDSFNNLRDTRNFSLPQTYRLIKNN